MTERGTFVFKRGADDETSIDPSDNARKIINGGGSKCKIPKGAIVPISMTKSRSEYIMVEHYPLNGLHYLFQITFLKPYTLPIDIICARIIEVHNERLGDKPGVKIVIKPPAIFEDLRGRKTPFDTSKIGGAAFDKFTVKMHNVLRVPFITSYLVEHCVTGYALLDAWNNTRENEPKRSPMWTGGSSK